MMEGTEAEANSVIALLMLDSAKGVRSRLKPTAHRKWEALAAVIALFNAGLMRIAFIPRWQRAFRITGREIIDAAYSPA